MSDATPLVENVDGATSLLKTIESTTLQDEFLDTLEMEETVVYEDISINLKLLLKKLWPNRPVK